MVTHLLIIVWTDNSRTQIEFWTAPKESVVKKLLTVATNFAGAGARIKGSVLMLNDGHIAQYSAGETLEILGLED